jgi:hypothetical protein
VYGKRGEALLQPSNPDNMAAGGVTDTQCGEGGRRRRKGGVTCSREQPIATIEIDTIE